MSCFFRGKWNGLRSVRMGVQQAFQPLRRHGWIRIIGLLLLAAALPACTGIKLGYNNGVDLAVWWLDGYVDLDKSQTRQLREDLVLLQRQHRQQQLPSYAEWLNQAQTLVTHDLAPEQICSMGNQVRGFVDELLLSGESAATTLALSLTPAQLAQLERKYAKNNAEFRKEWLAPEPAEMRAKRYDKALERAEMVYGRVTPAQKALIRQQVELSGFDPQLLYAERQRRQTDILQTLRQLQRAAPGAADTLQAVRGLLQRATHSPQAAYRSYAAALAQQDCQGMAAVHNSTTAKQREAAVRWLGSYEKSLQELVAQR